MEHQDWNPEAAPTWREFEDFREECRHQYRALEQKLWGLVAAVFLLVVGYVIGQFNLHGGVPAAQHATGAIVVYVGHLIRR